MVATSIYVDSNPLAFWGGQVCCHQEFGHCLAMIWSTWRPPLCKPKVQWKKWASYTTSFTPHKKNATTFNLATMWVRHPMSLSGSSQGFSHHPPRPWCYHHHSHLKTPINFPPLIGGTSFVSTLLFPFEVVETSLKSTLESWLWIVPCLQFYLGALLIKTPTLYFLEVVWPTISWKLERKRL